MRRQFTRGDRVKQRLPRTIHRTESPEILVLLCNVIWANLISVDIYRGKYYWDKHLIRHSSASMSDDIFAPQQCDGEATESHREPQRATESHRVPPTNKLYPCELIPLHSIRSPTATESREKSKSVTKLSRHCTASGKFQGKRRAANPSKVFPEQGVKVT